MTVGMLSPVGSERGAQRTGQASGRASLPAPTLAPGASDAGSFQGQGVPACPGLTYPSPVLCPEAWIKPQTQSLQQTTVLEKWKDPTPTPTMASVGRGDPSGATHLGDRQAHRDFFQRPPQR